MCIRDSASHFPLSAHIVVPALSVCLGMDNVSKMVNLATIWSYSGSCDRLALSVKYADTTRIGSIFLSHTRAEINCWSMSLHIVPSSYPTAVNERLQPVLCTSLRLVFNTFCLHFVFEKTFGHRAFSKLLDTDKHACIHEQRANGWARSHRRSTSKRYACMR